MCSLIYRKNKKKYLKILLQFLDSPETYRKYLTDFYKKYESFKSKKYSEAEIKILFEKLLKENGLRLSDDVVKELKIKKTDNSIILEFRQRIESLENKIILQDEDMNILKKEIKQIIDTITEEIILLKNKNTIIKNRKNKSKSKVVVL